MLDQPGEGTGRSGPLRLDSAAPGFEARFKALLAAKREVSEDVDAVVATIIADVVARGDAALIEASARFDRIDLEKLGLRVTAAEIEAAVETAPRDAVAALAFAGDRILAFHERQRPADQLWTDAEGVELGWRWTAIEGRRPLRAGRYGKLSVIRADERDTGQGGGLRACRHGGADAGRQAQPAGPGRSPAGRGRRNLPHRGAQAIAALAYGTQTIAPVSKIVGPGNAYVAAAKRRVFGTVGIDMIAGPSEVVVLADRTGHPDWIAADLLAQAEHDEAAQSILITDDSALAAEVEKAVAAQLKTLPRAAIASASWRDYGAIILVPDLGAAIPLVNRLAPEHLEIVAADADDLSGRVRNAGAIFLGGHTPEAIGDYVGGSNHVLPTARSARFASGLGVLDFMKRTSILKCGPEALATLAPAAIALGEAEGLSAHARSVALRTNRR